MGPAGAEAPKSLCFWPHEATLSDTDPRFSRSAAAITPWEFATRVRARKEHPAVWYSSLLRSNPQQSQQPNVGFVQPLQPLRVVRTMLFSRRHALHDTQLSRTGRW